jgi:uncharacterized protein YndB with AHSA1/START domain
MSLHLQVTRDIDRPLAKVFKFFAAEHHLNHPRWDPDIELWKTTEMPMGVGTVLKRRNSRSGTPVDGTMEIVEFEQDKVFGVVIHDGPMEIRSRAVFAAPTRERTIITIDIDIPAMDESMKDFLLSRLDRSDRNMKQLIEAEL